MGVKLFAWIGGFALFLGVAFFVKYSFDNNLISPEVRIALSFLTGIGLHVDLTAFTDPRNILLAAVILFAAVLSKFIGCGIGAYGLGRVNALRVGVGMIPRGEVGMVVAQIGLGFGIIKQNVYGVVVFMSVATTIVAPPLINIAFRGLMQKGVKEKEDFRIG